MSEDENNEQYIKELEQNNRVLQEKVNELTKTEKQQIDFSGKRCRIGVMSDSHKASLYEEQPLEDRLIKYFNDKKVDMVLHAGDFLDGEKMYKGHEYELAKYGADAQIQHAVETFPYSKAPVYFITGNHDGAYWKTAGIDVGQRLDAERDDLHYVGAEQRTIQLKPNADIMLMHPGGGCSYAFSYKPQKLIESFSGGEKPNILLSGHYHKFNHLFYRNVQGFMVPCTQNQTPFMKRKPCTFR